MDSTKLWIRSRWNGGTCIGYSRSGETEGGYHGSTVFMIFIALFPFQMICKALENLEFTLK